MVSGTFTPLPSTETKLSTALYLFHKVDNAASYTVQIIKIYKK